MNTTGGRSASIHRSRCLPRCHVSRAGPWRTRCPTRSTQAIGIPTVALAPRSLLATLPDDVYGVALEPLPTEPLLSALLQSAVALQLLTLGLVGLAGTNPDLIRREERAYREAALLGDATPDW